MATISVPLSAQLQEQLDALVAQGVGSNRADVMRRALENLAEEEAIKSVMKSMQEIKDGKVLRGDLRKALA